MLRAGRCGRVVFGRWFAEVEPEPEPKIELLFVRKGRLDCLLGCGRGSVETVVLWYVIGDEGFAETCSSSSECSMSMAELTQARKSSSRECIYRDVDGGGQR